jgi:hypothetical protein
VKTTKREVVRSGTSDTSRSKDEPEASDSCALIRWRDRQSVHPSLARLVLQTIVELQTVHVHR